MGSGPGAVSAFASETAVSAAGDGQYRTRLDGRWNIGANPNGGYAATAGLRALAQATERPDPLSTTTHFLRPGLGDADADIATTVLRSGGRTAAGSVELSQEGETKIATTAVMGDLSNPRPGPSLDGPTPVGLAAPEDCIDRADLEQGIDLPILARVEARIDPRWATGGASPTAEVGGWIRFRDQAAPDVLALALFADAFPPSVFSLLGRIGWVPTLELTVHVRRRPVDGWIRGHFRTQDLADGLMTEDGELWDESGALVARSRQLAMVRPT